MRIDKSLFNELVTQVLNTVAMSLDETEISVESFLLMASTLPQFEMAFTGDKRILQQNLHDILDENSVSVIEDNTVKDKSKTAIVNDDLYEALTIAMNILEYRSPKKLGEKVCLADVLLALSYYNTDFNEYIILSGGNECILIDNMYIAEDIKYSCIEYYNKLSDKDDEKEVARGKKSDVNWKNYCKDLLEEEKDSTKILVGREKELDETIRILCRKEKANPIHLGDAGVGKTEITLGLARKINNNDVPEKLKGSKLYSLDMGGLLANTEYRGEMEGRLKSVIDELEEQSNECMVILYIDEIHMIEGAGKTEGGSMDVANLIKPLLTKSNIRVIGATTYEEYKQCIEKDKALARRFKLVTVVEPTPSEAKEILHGIAPSYEEYHHVKYDKEALDEIVDLTVKYVHDKKLPDKAIDIMDEAGANISKNYKEGDKDIVITSSMIEEIIAKSYNIPVETVVEDDIKKLRELENNVKEHVFGQDEAVKECVDSIKLSRLGLTDENKPIASLLFVGQTGVGKTEVAIQISKALGIDFVRFDMSEYSDDMSVTKLIGASAGYVGYEDGGLLVEEIRKHPHCVLLLDEIEKASPKVFNTLLQVMDNATLTDNKGRQADFKNVLIIMTSNAGASGIARNGLGFGSDSKIIDFSNMDKAVKDTFTPEFRNRLTKIVKFNSMSDDMAELIVRKRLDEFIKLLKTKNISATYNNDVVKLIKIKGITKEFGARELLRVINRDIKMLFVDLMLNGKNNNVSITVEGDNLVLK